MDLLPAAALLMAAFVAAPALLFSAAGLETWLETPPSPRLREPEPVAGPAPGPEPEPAPGLALEPDGALLPA